MDCGAEVITIERERHCFGRCGPLGPCIWPLRTPRGNHLSHHTRLRKGEEPPHRPELATMSFKKRESTVHSIE